MVSSSTVWARKKRKELIRLFGGKCKKCEKTDKLEFAHLKETKLKGEGRGSTHRAKDIIENKDKYELFCRDCHIQFDKENPNGT